MTKDALVAKHNGPVAWLTLNRPDVMNALNSEILDRLEQQLMALAEDPCTRVVVLTGSGKAFCAGADLKDTNEQTDAALGDPDFLDRAEQVFGQLRQFPKPIVAALNGLTLAGGLELTMCCDLVIAAKSAKLGDAHANFGVFPGGGGASVLPRMIPLNVAKYLLFTGEFVPAEDLERFGLVNEIVEDAMLVQKVQELAERISNKSPASLRRMKSVANESHDKSRADALRHEQYELRKHQRSFDMAEGLAAFMEKREPQFRGT